MKYTVIEAADDQEFAQKAKDAFRKAIARVPSHMPRVILPTGKTPEGFYQALREDGNVPLFQYVQLDEYLGLAQDDPRLFSNWLARVVLDPLAINSRMIFNSSADPESEVKRITRWMGMNDRVDIAVLGIGANGHVGFNEPGSGFDEGVRVVDLARETVAANKAYWDNADDLPERAFTLGIADLKRVRQTILLVKGEGKAEILQRALRGEITTDVPASYLQRQQGVTVVADTAALSLMAR